jgi:hypothetical protein
LVEKTSPAGSDVIGKDGFPELGRSPLDMLMLLALPRLELVTVMKFLMV